MAALLPAPRGARPTFAGHRHRHGTAVRSPAHGEDEGQPLPRSPSLCQNLPRHRRTRTVSPTRWLSSYNPSLVCPDFDTVFAVCANASRTGGENSQEVHPKVVDVRPVPGGRRLAAILASGDRTAQL